MSTKIKMQGSSFCKFSFSKDAKIGRNMFQVTVTISDIIHGKAAI